MTASDVKDKELIIRILSMSSDGEKREQEIKNLAATYVEIADKILPQLRRSSITVSADEMSRTDEEITQLTNSDSTVLSIEEILYAATLSNDLEEKLRIYKLAKSQYSKDWRGHNNVGYVYVLKNDMKAAKAEFDAAAGVEKNATISNNMGVVALFLGDVTGAKEMFVAASGAGTEVNYNKGIIAVKQADYSDAVSKFGSENTFNSALAKVLNGDNEGALKAIEASEAKESAEGYYLKAVIGARTANKDLMNNNLKSAIAKDASLKAKAMNDAEFLKYTMDAGFIALFAN
jgi:Flp pilus assembly protein TadD